MRIRRARQTLISAAAIFVTAGAAVAIAGSISYPIDPSTLPGIGTLSASGGSLTINTDTLTITGAASFSGSTYVQGDGLPDICYFNFNGVDIGAGATINVIGSRPLALLSKNNMTILPTINLSGGNAFGPAAGAGGAAGGYSGGIGATTGSPGGGPGGAFASGSFHDAGGGGYGGPGGRGDAFAVGGNAYGGLGTVLLGGSGGGGALGSPMAGGGGGGAGGLELGAVGTIIAGAVIANGGEGRGGVGSNDFFSGGGGAGGAILIHASNFGTAALSAAGGSGGAYGGGGGGGRISLNGSTYDASVANAKLNGLLDSVDGGLSGFEEYFGFAGVATLRPDLVNVNSGQSLNVGIAQGQSGRTDARAEMLPKSVLVSGGTASIISPLTWTSGGAVTLNGGTLAINSTATFTSGTNLNYIAGTLAIAGGKQLVFDGGSGTIAPGSGLVLRADGLGIGAGSYVDVGDNDVIVGTLTTKGSIESAVRTARNGGTWNAPGLTSIVARNNAAKTTGLAVISGAEYDSVGGNGSFSGQTYTPTDTLVKYTWNGDANLDGRVTFDDYVRIDTGFNTGLTGWLNGDFNYSGSVNFDDYVLIDIAFNSQSGTLQRTIDWISGDDRSESGLAAAEVSMVMEHFELFGSAYAQQFLAAIPEPHALGALILATFPKLAIRRRRRCRTGARPLH